MLVCYMLHVIMTQYNLKHPHRTQLYQREQVKMWLTCISWPPVNWQNENDPITEGIVATMSMFGDTKLEQVSRVIYGEADGY